MNKPGTFIIISVPFYPSFTFYPLNKSDYMVIVTKFLLKGYYCNDY